MKNILTLVLILFSVNAMAAQLVMYTDRPAATTALIASAFKAQTGNDLNIVEMKTSDLLSRLEAEGPQTNGADVIFVKDLVYLNQINEGQFFQPYAVANANTVPSIMKSTNWIGITYRARTVVYNTITVDPSTIKNYADLATPEWAGRVCVRSSSSSYNEALIANLIADEGTQKTTDIIAGWLQNLAAEPYADDTSAIKAVADGTCDVAVANTYYLGRLFATDPQLPLGVVFVGQDTTGTHTNGSGIGISSASQQKDLANKLIEIMLSPELQKTIVAATFEFPANSTVTHPNAKVGSWMGFKANSTAWADLTPFLNQSTTLMKSVNYK